MNPRAILLAVVVLLAGLAGLAGWQALANRTPAAPAVVSTAPGNTFAPSLLPPLPPSRPLPAAAAPLRMSPADQAFLGELRGKFRSRLNDRHARIKAIEKIVAYLQAKYPQDWRTRVKAFLAALAPELTDELLAAFDGLMRLDEWLGSHREELAGMTTEERRAALWAARHEAFGADAEAIYEAEIRNNRIGDALLALNDAVGLSTEEKLAQYLAVVRESWGDDAPAFIEARGTELMNQFLDVPAVQQDLRGQAPAQRSETLRRIRTGLGLDEPALARWDSLDALRDQAWDTGQQYWQARAQITAQYSGAEREARIQKLQDQMLGEEAATVREEEAGGFYRYDRPRRIGRE